MQVYASFKNLFLLLAISLGLCSCDPDPIEPVTDKNAQLLLDKVTLHEFFMADYIRGVSTLDFLVVDSLQDSSTVRMVDSFYLPSPIDYKRTYDFDVPKGALQCTIALYFFAKNGLAEQMTIKNMVFRYNDEVLLDKPLVAGKHETSTGTEFVFPAETIDF